ncbi:protease inhibitor I42 family protein [Entomomonas asaccharolytica]|uniref:Protease inhibitor I42 family protein n=1 Tax=Entomomonas asaccharolytica TaxID=2785331 RepID=A0A974RX32_9GAMM|nr:protease inhibitor I42 family protein [Entomomonas asaccharolytica]QQP85821.1 protease inhibitor I42 family protein [Entomomonas asaccharolytica]
MRVFVVIAASILLVSCASKTIAPLVVMDQFACQTIKLAVNQELVVNLPSNPSTGYRWSMVKHPDFLRVVEADNYQQDKMNGEPRVGMDGQSLWIFRAEATGSDQLDLIYHRPWEKEQAPAKQLSCKITVS